MSQYRIHRNSTIMRSAIRNAFIATLLSIMLPNFTSAQTGTLHVGEDTTVCLNTQIQILDTTFIPNDIRYLQNVVPFNMINTANQVILDDDEFSGIINIGFDFCFYGNTYNQLVIHSNSYVSFDIANAKIFIHIGITIVR